MLSVPRLTVLSPNRPNYIIRASTYFRYLERKQRNNLCKSSKMEFEGKVAIVTGAAQGIGAAYCQTLLGKGMKVCMSDIKDKPVDFFAQLPEELKENIIFEKCDVTSKENLKSIFDKTIENFGRIDLVINNAGIIDENNWMKSINVNIIGVIYGIELGFQYMGKNNGGSGGYIVNTASNLAFKPFPLGPIYCGTKHAIAGMTKSYGTDYHFERTGVKVCSVCPGATDTENFHVSPNFTLDPELAVKNISSIKPAKPQYIADGLIKLLEEGRNGALLRVEPKGIYYAE